MDRGLHHNTRPVTFLRGNVDERCYADHHDDAHEDREHDDDRLDHPAGECSVRGRVVVRAGTDA